MTNHLTEDQISRWVIDRSTNDEQIHVRACNKCMEEVDRFRNTLALFRAGVRHRVERRPAAQAVAAASMITSPEPGFFHFVQSPSLLASLKRAIVDTLYPPAVETTAAPIEVREIWSKDSSRHSGLLSLLVHGVILGILVIPAAALRLPPPTETSVMLLKTAPLVLNVPDRANRGGGGGGMKAPTPPSKGLPPRGADKQLAPPMVEAKNLNPDLIVEPTIVAPQLANMPQFNFSTIGDPNGVAGPPSPGPGTGGGIGTGNGRGVGEGRGPGLGPGEAGGTGGGVFSVGGGVSAPIVVFKPQPEYSEDGRKARAQGTVEMLIVVKEDGSVEFKELVKRLGYGLDQKAIDAVRKWKFEPGKKDGKAVAVFVSVLVNFTLR